MLGFSAAPFVGGVDCAFGAGFLLVGALLALNSVNMMYSVYVLYHIALYFQIGKELSLAQVTELCAPLHPPPRRKYPWRGPSAPSGRRAACDDGASGGSRSDASDSWCPSAS
jgi:hypothetical protein